MRRSEKRKSQKQEHAGARQGRKVTIHCVFPMIWGSGGSKSNLAKAAGAELAGQMRDEKVYAVVARSTFPSQNVQNTPASDHCWKFRCPKRGRRCGAKHISKSKVSKSEGYRPLFDVQMSKKWTLTNSTNLTNFTNFTNLTNLTNLANTTDFTKLTN